MHPSNANEYVDWMTRVLHVEASEDNATILTQVYYYRILDTVMLDSLRRTGGCFLKKNYLMSGCEPSQKTLLTSESMFISQLTPSIKI